MSKQITLEQLVELCVEWHTTGKFTHNGLTWRWGINQHGASEILTSLAWLKITDLAGFQDEIMGVENLGDRNPVPHAAGFTIGERGKKLYWWIIPQPSGLHKVFRDDNGTPIAPRHIEPVQMVRVHYKY